MSQPEKWVRYTLTLDELCCDVVVDVRDPGSPETQALCHEINDFWSGAFDRLSDAGGDVVVAVLRNLTHCAIREDLQWGGNALQEFCVRGVEGWPKLDGSCGIRLVSVDEPDLDVGISHSTAPAPDETVAKMKENLAAQAALDHLARGEST